MNIPIHNFRSRLLGLGGTVTALAVLGLMPASAWGQTAEELRLTVGKSVVIDYPADIRQISTSSPDVVDASPITTREILMHGKGLGNATLVVWSKAGDRMFYNVSVEMNLDPVRRIIKDTFPNEQITVNSSRDTLTLTGKASSKDIADRVVAVSSGFAKTVINNMAVSSVIDKQVLLRVRFAELDRQKETQYGLNWIANPGGTAIYSSTGQFGSPTVSNPGGPGAITTITIPQALNLFAFNPSLGLGAFIKALEAENILQILAEPNLVTTNGKEASFLVGGEFPIPISQGGAAAGAISVQFREFGIKLRFTPTVTTNNTIKMHLAQEVSTIDVAHGVTINGFSIPALSSRKTETDVELGEGQSFVVSGLLDNRETESLSKIPIIGDIPILGKLFTSKDVTRNRTDLILIVTPEMTQPLSPTDTRPEITFPRDFLKKIDQADVNKGKDFGKTSAKK